MSGARSSVTARCRRAVGPQRWAARRRSAGQPPGAAFCGPPGGSSCTLPLRHDNPALPECSAGFLFSGHRASRTEIISVRAKGSCSGGNRAGDNPEVAAASLTKGRVRPSCLPSPVLLAGCACLPPGGVLTTARQAGRRVMTPAGPIRPSSPRPATATRAHPPATRRTKLVRNSGRHLAGPGDARPGHVEHLRGLAHRDGWVEQGICRYLAPVAAPGRVRQPRGAHGPLTGGHVPAALVLGAGLA